MEPTPPQEILERAAEDAKLIEECIAFALCASEGVKFYSEDAFDDDGELCHDPK